MSFQDLLAWIRLGQMETRQPEDILRLVDAAIKGMAEDDDRYQPLVDIEGALLIGKVPHDELLRLAREFGSAKDGDPDE